MMNVLCGPIMSVLLKNEGLKLRDFLDLQYE